MADGRRCVVSDEELARHLARAYLIAAQEGGDPWVAAARMAKAWLCPLEATREQ